MASIYAVTDKKGRILGVSASADRALEAARAHIAPDTALLQYLTIGRYGEPKLNHTTSKAEVIRVMTEAKKAGRAGPVAYCDNGNIGGAVATISIVSLL